MAGNEEVVETLSLKIKVEYDGNNKLRDFGKSVKELTPQVEKLARSLRPLLNGLKSIGATGNDLKKMSGDLTKSSKAMEEASNSKDAVKGKNEKETTNTDTKATDRMLKQVEKLKKVKGIFTGLLRSIGRIALYRAIRSAIKAVTEAFSEGIQNAYQWSKSVNGEFAKSMDSIATSMEYLKNSIGAALIPMIKALEPVIDSIVDKIVSMINAVNRFVSAATGSKTWTEAVKKNVQYAKSVDKVKRSLLGFDEINQLQGEDDSTDVTKSYDFIERKLEGQDLATKLGTMVAKAKVKLADLKKSWKELVEKIKGSDIYKNLETGFGKFKTWIDNFKKKLTDPETSIGRFIENCKNLALAIADVVSQLVGGTSKLSGFVDILLENIGIDFSLMVDQFNNCCDLLYAIGTGDWAAVWEAVKNIYFRFVQWMLQRLLLLGKGIGTILDLLNMDVFGWKDIDIHMWDATVDGKLPELDTPKNNYSGESSTNNGTTTVNTGTGTNTAVVGNVYLDGKELYNSTVKYSQSQMRTVGRFANAF